MLRATQKTLTELVDTINTYRARAGLCPYFFAKQVHSLKLQNRYSYTLYVFPKPGEQNIEALGIHTNIKELRLYLAGMLDGLETGMKIAAKESVPKLTEVAK